MVAEQIWRIPVVDLRTVRLSIKGIATELPLDIEQVNKFFSKHARDDGVSQGLHEAVVGLVDDMLKAQKCVSDDIGIEFVISDPDSK